MIAPQFNTPTLRARETIGSQASGVVSAPRFSAANVTTGGLTPNGTDFRLIAIGARFAPGFDSL